MGSGTVTREKILKAALDIFTEHGYDGARMEKIASRVGINKASLYFYFKSKEDIFRELFSSILGKFYLKMNEIINASKGLNCRQRLTFFYQRYLDYNLGNSEMAFWNRIYYAAPEIMKDEIIKATGESKTFLINTLTNIMEEGIKNKELKHKNPRDMALTFYYLITCIDLSTDLMNKETAVEEMEQCFNVLWEGIKGEN